MGLGSPMAWTFGVLAVRETLPIIKAAQANTAVPFTVYFIFYTSFTIKKIKRLNNYEYTQTFNFCQTKNYSHVFQTSGT